MPKLHGFDEAGARRVVDATRGWEKRLRNPAPMPHQTGVPYRGFWARLQAIEDVGADFYDAGTESYSWVRQLQEPDGEWIQHPLVDVAERRLCGFNRAFAPDLAAGFEVNRILTPEDTIVWMRPGSQDEIDGEERATRCYLFDAPGGGGGGWVKLLSRCERAYLGIEVRPQETDWPSTRWKQCTDPRLFVELTRRFDKNLFDVNGCAFNCAGGVQPLITRYWPGSTIDANRIFCPPACPEQPCVPTRVNPTSDDPNGEPIPFFLIDLGGTNECDGERHDLYS